MISLLAAAVAPIGGLLHLIIIGVVLALICYILFWAMGYLGVPDPIRKVVTVLVVLIAFIWILSIMLPMLGVGWQ